MTFPAADDIALAVVTAAALTGEDPAAIIRGAPRSRARCIAYAALREAFPEARRGGLAACLGYRDSGTAAASLNMAAKSQWWSDIHVDEVVGAVVAGRYGERAA